jgi:hypothetical protein
MTGIFLRQDLQDYLDFSFGRSPDGNGQTQPPAANKNRNYISEFK